MIIIVGSDNSKYNSNKNNYNYIENIKIILYTLYKFHSNIKVSVYIINSSIQRKNELSKVHPLADIIMDTVSGSAKFIRDTMTSYRIPKMRDHLKNNKYVLWIDSDCIINKPLYELLNKINNDKPQLHIKIRAESPKRYFNNGVILLNSTKETQNLMDTWVDIVKTKYEKYYGDISDKGWGPNQISLYDTYNIHKEKVKFYNLENKFNDMPDKDNKKSGNYFKDDSIIWHCIGQINDPKWKNKYNEILNNIIKL